MHSFVRLVASGFCLWALAAPVSAQSGAGLAFDGMAIDPEAPVEVSADQLSVSQTDGTAIFSGNVRVVQGELNLTASEMQIEYEDAGEGQGQRISQLIATGGVTLVTPTEAAEASEAVYSMADGTVTMSGDVLLTQGPNAISGDQLVIDLATGSGRVEGRVRTTLQAGTDN